ncbi:MAG: hypothetical protein MZV70_28505 [Desulfobacterales bacterium]|nr:hypothetical protein [Desulfobacterales bacterium]
MSVYNEEKSSGGSHESRDRTSEQLQGTRDLSFRGDPARPFYSPGGCTGPLPPEAVVHGRAGHQGKGYHGRSCARHDEEGAPHLFVGENVRDKAYADHPLPIGEGQTISQPYIVALMTGRP